MRKRYCTVKIPVELSDELDKLEGALGYTSRADIVNDAIRRFIESRPSSFVKMKENVRSVSTKAQLHGLEIST